MQREPLVIVSAPPWSQGGQSQDWIDVTQGPLTLPLLLLEDDELEELLLLELDEDDELEPLQLLELGTELEQELELLDDELDHECELEEDECELDEDELDGPDELEEE
jgi:hypothetical protein